MAEPTEMSIGAITAILQHFGYRLVNIAGSHFHFKKDGKSPIIIPVHHQKVARVYIIMIRATIKDYII